MQFSASTNSKYAQKDLVYIHQISTYGICAYIIEHKCKAECFGEPLRY